MKDSYVRLGHRELYRNPWLTVEAHEILHPNGLPGEHVLVVSPQASAVVVEDGDDLLFTRQPRFGARRSVVEIVKGGREGEETALACAQRELREELGVTAKRWTELGNLYEIPSIVSEPVTIFLARTIEASQAQPESVESIEPVRMSIAAAIEGVEGGTIDDAVTVAALFRYVLISGYCRSRLGS
jgi:8-oxo-dGTP pyrophosphatase MutT (NUDIX family)